MSINFADIAKAANPAAAANAGATNTGRDGKPQRAPAQVYLNVGFTIPVPQEDGTVEDVFIAIPMGIGLDNMEDLEMKGSNQNWNNMVQAKNALLAQLKKMAEGLEPGADTVVEGLEVQIKRVGKVAAPAAGENPLLAAMSERFKTAA